MKKLIDAAYARCEQLLRDNMDILDRLAAFLLQHETMDNAQLEAIFKGETPPEHSTVEPLAKRQAGDKAAQEVMAELAKEEAQAKARAQSQSAEPSEETQDEEAPDDPSAN